MLRYLFINYILNHIGINSKKEGFAYLFSFIISLLFVFLISNENIFKKK